MTCETCGEKPKKCGNCNKDFPRTVIEIDNPETLVLLRKVVIPASMGDDTVVLPAIGKYHNVVLYYEANKRVYIYSSDGVPTPIEAGVPQEILDKIADLEEEIDTSIGKAKVLTSADYNWNSSTQSATEPYNCVAVWLLPAGIYHKTDSSVYARTTLVNLLDTDEIVIVGKPNSNNERPLLELDATVYAGGAWSWATAMVVPTSGNVAGKYYELKPPADDLTTTGMDIPLAAKQGKILNERIGDLSTLTTTAKTSAVAAINELGSRVIGSLTSAPTTSTVGSVGSLLATVESGTGHLYICTDDTGGTYTWQTLV